MPEVATLAGMQHHASEVQWLPHQRQLFKKQSPVSFSLAISTEIQVMNKANNRLWPFQINFQFRFWLFQRMKESSLSLNIMQHNELDIREARNLV